MTLKMVHVNHWNSPKKWDMGRLSYIHSYNTG